MELLSIVNQRLKDNYGEGINSLPKYRIVWSTAELETRQTQVTSAGLILQRPQLVPNLPKYPMNQDRWILEQVLPNVGNPELPGTYSYEPLWVFADKDSNYIDYDWEIIEKIIYFHIHKQAPKNASILAHDEEEKIKAEEAETLDLLQHEDPFPNRMYDTPIITVPSNYKEH